MAKLHIEHLFGLHKRTEEILDEMKDKILKTYPAPIVPDLGVVINDQAVRTSITTTAIAANLYMGNGKPNANLVMSNGTRFTAKLWGDKVNIPQVQEWMDAGQAVFKVEGDVTEYNGQKQLTLRNIAPADPGEALQLLPHTKEHPEDLTLELFNEISKLPEVVRAFFHKYFSLFWHDFRIMAAARGKHHAYASGLVTHVSGLGRIIYDVYHAEDPVTRMKEQIDLFEKEQQAMLDENEKRAKPTTERYLPLQPEEFGHMRTLVSKMKTALRTQKLEWVPLCMGYILHDGGKLFEYRIPGTNPDKWKVFFPDAEPISSQSIEMDPIGVKQGHIHLGLKMMNLALSKTETPVPMQLLEEVEHLILSHHGKLEWGSPVEPQTANAILLHFADYVDSRYAALKEWREQA